MPKRKDQAQQSRLDCTRRHERLDWIWTSVLDRDAAASQIRSKKQDRKPRGTCRAAGLYLLVRRSGKRNTEGTGVAGVHVGVRGGHTNPVWRNAIGVSRVRFS